MIALHAAKAQVSFEAVTNWAERKQELMACGKAPFGQLPLVEMHTADGQDVCMTQMNAILTFIGDEFGLGGDGSALQRYRVQQWLAGAEDLRTNYVRHVYRGGYEDDKQLAAGIRAESGRNAFFGDDGELAKFERHLAAQRTGAEDAAFLANGTFSVADISFWCVVDNLAVVCPEALTAFPEIQKLHAHVAAMPDIKAYLDTKPAHRSKINGNQLGSGFSL